MKAWQRRTVFGAGGLLALGVLALGGAYGMSAAAVGNRHTAEPHAFDASSGDAMEGQRLAGIYGCTACHGDNLAGQIILDDMPFARIAASNLTAGAPAGALDEAAFERAVRHGVGRDGRALFIMPSAEYTYLSDQDVADIFTYIRSMPAVESDLPARAFGPVGRTMIALGKVPFQPTLIAADPAAAHLSKPSSEDVVELGHYLTRICTGCHGLDLAGAPSPDGGPPGANLTPAGNLKNWSLDDFRAFLSTGKTPEGRELDPDVMPWYVFGKMQPSEIEAIWTYLQTVAPKEGITRPAA